MGAGRSRKAGTCSCLNPRATSKSQVMTLHRSQFACRTGGPAGLLGDQMGPPVSLSAMRARPRLGLGVQPRAPSATRHGCGLDARALQDCGDVATVPPEGPLAPPGVLPGHQCLAPAALALAAWPPVPTLLPLSPRPSPAPLPFWPQAEPFRPSWKEALGPQHTEGSRLGCPLPGWDGISCLHHKTQTRWGLQEPRGPVTETAQVPA